MKTKVIFICVHNSARSQMAEAFVNHHYGDHFQAESAGLDASTLNPLAVEVMAEEGIDISKAACKTVWDTFKSGEVFGYVVTVCDDANAERCPIFPGNAIRAHWDVPDPSSFDGSPDEKLAKFREVRDRIAKDVREFCEEKINAVGQPA